MRKLLILRKIQIRTCRIEYCGDGCCSFPNWDTDWAEVGDEFDESDRSYDWDFDQDDYIEYMDYMWVER